MNIIRQYILFFLLCAYCPVGEAQIPTGNYINGDRCEGDFCGGWVINSDSSFYLYSFNEHRNLDKIGKGKVIKYTDSLIYFEFRNDFEIPNRLEYYNYSANRGKPDSIYLTLKVTTEKKIALPIGQMMVFYGEKFMTLLSDSLYTTTIPRNGKERYGLLTIHGRGIGEDPLQFFLNPATNYHEISIIVSGQDSLYCRSIGRKFDSIKDTVKLLVKPARIKERPYLPHIYAAPYKKSELLILLKECRKKQAYLLPVIDDLIAFINSDN